MNAQADIASQANVTAYSSVSSATNQDTTPDLKHARDDTTLSMRKQALLLRPDRRSPNPPPSLKPG